MLAGSVTISVLILIFASEGFSTAIFAAVTAIVSVGILSAAVAAAVYTKPTWEDFRQQLLAYRVHFHAFSLRDATDTALQSKVVPELNEETTQQFLMMPNLFGPPVFLIPSDGEIVVKFQVGIVSDEDEREVGLRFNLIVPADWDLTTTQADHDISPARILYPLGPSEIEVTYSIATRTLSPREMDVFYAEIRPRRDALTLVGRQSPMAFRVGLGPRTDPIRHDWTIEIQDPKS
jgi:hypothetical protein